MILILLYDYTHMAYSTNISYLFNHKYAVLNEPINNPASIFKERILEGSI